MNIEHVVIKQLPNDLLSLDPEKGYILMDKISHKTFPHADIEELDLPNWGVQKLN